MGDDTSRRDAGAGTSPRDVRSQAQASLLAAYVHDLGGARGRATLRTYLQHAGEFLEACARQGVALSLGPLQHARALYLEALRPQVTADRWLQHRAALRSFLDWLEARQAAVRTQMRGEKEAVLGVLSAVRKRGAPREALAAALLGRTQVSLPQLVLLRQEACRATLAGQALRLPPASGAPSQVTLGRVEVRLMRAWLPQVDPGSTYLFPGHSTSPLGLNAAANRLLREASRLGLPSLGLAQLKRHTGVRARTAHVRDVPTQPSAA